MGSSHIHYFDPIISYQSERIKRGGVEWSECRRVGGKLRGEEEGEEPESISGLGSSTEEEEKRHGGREEEESRASGSSGAEWSGASADEWEGS